MAQAADVEAGRAYVTFYLRRVDYDQQVDQLERDNKQLEDQRANELPGQENRPSAAAARAAGQSTTEAGVSIPADLAESAFKGAGMRAGAVTLSKMVPIFRETATAASAAAPAVASVGAAAASTAPAVAATATAATTAAPAVAASGVAATGAAGGFRAFLAAAAPIVVPLAAIAAAVGLVYVAFAKWDELPGIVKALLLVTSPLVLAVRALVNAFKLLKLGVDAILAPFRIASAAIDAFKATIASIPGALIKVGQAAKFMATEIGKAAARAVVTLAAVPRKIAGFASDAVEGVSNAVRGFGVGLAKVGGIAAGLSAAIVGPMTLAAKDWAAYGDKIRGVQNDLLRFQLTAEEASIAARVSEQTGESIEKVAEQIRDGTRDFSRWRNELQQSGTLMSGGGLSAALALSRAYYSLRESLAGLKNAIAAALGPTLTQSTEAITGLVRGVAKWITENRPLVVQVFKIATSVGVAATAITTLGGAIAGAGAVLTPFTAALAAIAGGLAIVETRAGAGRSLWASYADSVKRVWEAVRDYLSQMLSFANRVIGGVKDALMAGDLAGAVTVAWSAAKVAWIAALTEIDRLSGGVIGGILQNLAAGRWAAAGEGAMNALRQVWIVGVGALSDLWTSLQQGFDRAMGFIEKAWIRVMEQLKRWGLQTTAWIANNALKPLIAGLSKIDPTGMLSGKAKSAFLDLAMIQKNAVRSLKSPEEMAAADRAINQKVLDKQTAREKQAAAVRLDREREITRLRQRQAELATMGAAVSKDRLTENQKALDKAIAAAEAAREAAAASRLKEEDFAVATSTESITRFSGEALGLSVGRSDDPASKAVKLNEEQLKVLRTIVGSLKDTFDEVIRLQSLGGFT